jgi:hypothetical protein
MSLSSSAPTLTRTGDSVADCAYGDVLGSIGDRADGRGVGPASGLRECGWPSEGRPTGVF